MIKSFVRTVFSFVKGVVYTSLVVSFVITVPIIIGVLLLPKDESEDNVTATRNFPFIGINILPSKDGQWKKVKTRTGVIVYVPGREAKIKKLIKDNKETVKIAFFHPFW